MKSTIGRSYQLDERPGTRYWHRGAKWPTVAPRTPASSAALSRTTSATVCGPGPARPSCPWPRRGPGRSRPGRSARGCRSRPTRPRPALSASATTSSRPWSTAKRAVCMAPEEVSHWQITTASESPDWMRSRATSRRREPGVPGGTSAMSPPPEATISPASAGVGLSASGRRHPSRAPPRCGRLPRGLPCGRRCRSLAASPETTPKPAATAAVGQQARATASPKAVGWRVPTIATAPLGRQTAEHPEHLGRRRDRGEPGGVALGPDPRRPQLGATWRRIGVIVVAPVATSPPCRASRRSSTGSGSVAVPAWAGTTIGLRHGTSARHRRGPRRRRALVRFASGARLRRRRRSGAPARLPAVSGRDREPPPASVAAP